MAPLSDASALSADYRLNRFAMNESFYSSL